MRLVLAVVSLLLPWRLRRAFLEKMFGFNLHPDSRIGFSLLLSRKLVMEKGSRIGHLNVCKGCDLIHLSGHATIGNLNWITGFPSGVSRHFGHQAERKPHLVMKAYSAISNRHLIDCTACVTIGAYAIVGGFYSQILTHSVDLKESRQAAEPIEIGDYCFLGTNCVILGGSVLPDYSVLGAKSLLNKAWSEPYQLYAGVPATKIKALGKELKYFQRTEGFIW